MTKQRYRNQIKQCKAYPSANINSDHNLVIIETQLKWTKIQKKLWKMEMLKIRIQRCWRKKKITEYKNKCKEEF